MAGIVLWTILIGPFAFIAVIICRNKAAERGQSPKGYWAIFAGIMIVPIIIWVLALVALLAVGGSSHSASILQPSAHAIASSAQPAPPSVPLNDAVYPEAASTHGIVLAMEVIRNKAYHNASAAEMDQYWISHSVHPIKGSSFDPAAMDYSYLKHGPFKASYTIMFKSVSAMPANKPTLIVAVYSERYYEDAAKTQPLGPATIYTMKYAATRVSNRTYHWFAVSELVDN